MTSPPGGAPRRLSVELGRFVAAASIVVAHHMQSPSDLIGHSALGLFLILTAFLAGTSAARREGRYDWSGRALRLFGIWLVWCAICRLVETAITDGPDRYALLLDRWSLLYGPSIHLWFLPFIMLAMVLVQPVSRLLRHDGGLAVGLAALAMVWPATNWVVEFMALPAPFPQWLFSVPYYIYGLLLVAAHKTGRVAVALFVMAFVSVVNYLMTGLIWSFGPILAAALFELFWRLPLERPWFADLGRASFGIYLMHPALSLIGYKILGAEGHWLPLSLIAFFLSWAGTMIWLRLPVLRNLV